MNMTEIATLPTPAPQRASLVQRTAGRYEVEPEKLLTTLKATCFKSDKVISNEQMMSLLIVAEQYNLNPFTKELFAFDDKKGGIVPFVSVDGWARIVNEHPQFDGVEFDLDPDEEAITCTLHRKDRSHPTVITEYLAECKRNTGPWQSHPRRMLRHKALIQCARLAFGFAGIHDQDEAERIRDGGLAERVDRPASTQRAHLQQVLHTSAEHLAQPVEDATLADEIEGTLAELEAEIIACSQDRDAADEVLDRGRSLLDEEEFAKLAQTYASVFNEEQ
jgi:phage recombination protein Bet